MVRGSLKIDNGVWRGAVRDFYVNNNNYNYDCINFCAISIHMASTRSHDVRAMSQVYYFAALLSTIILPAGFLRRPMARPESFAV